MANRRQKPADQLQGRGSAYKGTTDALLTADAMRKVPTAPKGLTTESRAIWREFFRSALGAAIHYPSDGPALRRWIWLVDKRQRLIERFEGEGEGREPLTTWGSTGNKVLNPLLKLEERLSREILVYEARFGMTPLDRLRIGIAIGQADESLDEMRKRLAARQTAAAGHDDIAPGEDGVIDMDGLA